MDLSNTVGFVAGLLTTLAFIPQVWKVWKSKSARDLSLPAFTAFTAGVAAWLAYGVLVDAPQIVFWNAVTLCLSGAILVMKVRFG